MAQMIFVNLPVRDLVASTRFYEALGTEKIAQFSNEDGSCIKFSETIYAMLLTHEKFATFSPKPIPDARASAQMLLALSANSRAAVDGYVSKAQASGGKADPCPVQDHGFMYGRSFEDPDGHIWEVFWMDAAAVKQS